jgi:hypothetical protein
MRRQLGWPDVLLDRVKQMFSDQNVGIASRDPATQSGRTLPALDFQPRIFTFRRPGLPVNPNRCSLPA